MLPNKLNFGCGNRFSPDWVNIDFHSESKHVRRVNLLNGFPFPDSSFEVVYSSHVLEHFDRHQGAFLISESFRVLTKGGVVRIVVPDLEGSVREYLRVLSMPDSPDKHRFYSWAIIELLDQLVRNRPQGEMGPYWDSVYSANDASMKDYVTSRTQNRPWIRPAPVSFLEKIKTVTPQKLATKCMYVYLSFISRLIPSSLRDVVFVHTAIGERHRWMYDEYGLGQLLHEVGFREIRRWAFDESRIPGFTSSFLDCEKDGKPYKNNSLYMEGVK
jgi:hypothetical protein